MSNSGTGEVYWLFRSLTHVHLFSHPFIGYFDIRWTLVDGPVLSVIDSFLTSAYSTQAYSLSLSGGWSARHMTSEMPCKSKLIDMCDQQILAHSLANGILSNRLLSPIIENSAEILSTPLPVDIDLSTASQKTPKLVARDNNAPLDGSTCSLLQGFHQCTRNLQSTHKHLSSANQHLKELTSIVDRLSQDETIVDIVEPIATRLIQLRVKAEEAVRLLNQPSIEKLAQQVRRSQGRVDHASHCCSFRSRQRFSDRRYPFTTTNCSPLFSSVWIRNPRWSIIWKMNIDTSNITWMNTLLNWTIGENFCWN